MREKSDKRRSAKLDEPLRDGEPQTDIDGLLPDTTGVEWLEKQRKAGRATPVLFVTSFWKSMRDFELVTKRLGATELLRKPVVAAQVADRVDALLGG